MRFINSQKQSVILRWLTRLQKFRATHRQPAKLLSILTVKRLRHWMSAAHL